MVASQNLRNWALTQYICDPNLELNELQYYILERIGRSRKAGLPSQGSNSLQLFSQDWKVLFYNRKALQQNRLVLRQLFWSETAQCDTLFHLSRFFNEIQSRSTKMISLFVEYLKTKPGYRMDYAEMRKVFGYRDYVKKLLRMKKFQQFIRSDVVSLGFVPSVYFVLSGIFV